MEPTGNDIEAENLAKAIRQRESGGNFNAVGDAGTSHGGYQFQPATWKSYAKEILGDSNAEMTPENQNAVAYGKIKGWKDSGKNAAQIAAMWNAGEGIGDNWQSHKGKTTINGKTISYDTPQYVKDVTDLYQQYKTQTAPSEVQAQRQSLESQGQPVSVNPEKAQPTFMGNVVRGIINPFAKLATSGVNLAQDIVGAPETQPFSGKYLGDVKKVGAGFDVTKGLTPENIKAVKESAGTGLELGSYLVGGGEAKAGLTAAKAGLSFGKGLLKQTGKGMLEGAGIGALGSAGSALEQNKGLVDTLASTATGALGGGLTGGALSFGGGVLSKLEGFTPATANLIKQKATKDLTDVLDSSTWGNKAQNNPKLQKDFSDMIDEGFIPNITKDGKRFDTTLQQRTVRDERIAPLQKAKTDIIDNLKGNLSLEDVKQSAILQAKNRYKDDVATLGDVLSGIDSHFKKLENAYPNGLTAKDVFNIQNSEQVSKFSKFEKAMDEPTQMKGKVARQIYYGTRDVLHTADDRLTELDNALDKYHRIENILGNKGLHGRTIPTGTHTWLSKLAASEAGRAVGTAVGGVFGGIPGAIAGGQVEQGLSRVLSKTQPLRSKVLKKGGEVLQQKGKQSVEGLINKTPKKLPTIKY